MKNDYKIFVIITISIIFFGINLDVKASVRSDVNLTRGITRDDIELVLKNSLEFDMTKTSWNNSSVTGDVNCDGSVNTVDAMILYKKHKDINLEGVNWCDNDDSLINKKTFIEDSTLNLLNPDRGFYAYSQNLGEISIYNTYEIVNDAGYKLIYAPIELINYKNTPVLPIDFLNNIDINLKEISSLDLKVILRFLYRKNIGEIDVSKEILFQHLEQLKPVLQDNKSVISVIQIGTLGPYGQWYDFSEGYREIDENYKNNRKSVVEKIMEIFPQKYLQIRTPMHKEMIYGLSNRYNETTSKGMITSGIAFTDDKRAKIGYHNDCFLKNKTNNWTYADDNVSFWKSYVANDSKYAPVGGEACGIGSTPEDAYLTSCENAVKELKNLKFSFLSDIFKKEVIDRWKNEGCYEEIKENLGYRFVSEKIEIRRYGNEYEFYVPIENKGYAAPYINSDIKFILYNYQNEYIMEDVIDTRRFFANKTHGVSVRIKEDIIQSGEYCLSLQIGKEGEFIRLSSSSIWENDKNKLICNIVF